MKIRLTKASTARWRAAVRPSSMHLVVFDVAAGILAQTEELMCDPAEIEPVVTELVRLAQIAASSTKGLFLWGSL